MGWSLQCKEKSIFLYLNVTYNVQQSWFILGSAVHCIERCFDKSNIFASFEKEV